LVALRPNVQPFKPVGAGNASLSSLYIAYRENDEVMAQGRGYFNLFDASCTDWKLCTGEGASSKGWLGGAGPFTILQDWSDNIDQLSFTPGGGKKAVDLSQTAPSGVISAPQWYLTINACGGSTHNSCGLWDGPTKGGPLGVVYSKVTLELIAECGDTQCSPGIETVQNCAADCGASGSGGAAGNGGAAGSAGQGAAAGTSSSGTGGGAAGSAGDAGSAATGGSAGAGGSGSGAGGNGAGAANASGDESGCSCSTPSRRPGQPWMLLSLLAGTAWLRRQRRAGRMRAGRRRVLGALEGVTRRALPLALGLLVIAGLLSLHSTASAAPEKKLRIATLAPKNSAWGKVFRVWQKAVDQKTKGRLALDVYYNAVQGNEASMVGKMKTGQLDGAALASVGLASIHRDVLVMQLPGIVDSWSILDKVRKAVAPDIEKRFLDEGFLILGWGDIGLVRQMSKGFAVRRPSDVKGKRPAVWRNEPMGPKIYAKIGGVVPVPLSAPEVLPALRAGKINIVNAPALAAEQLQWTSSLDHIAATSSVCAIGGVVFRKKALDGMPADLRETFLAIQEKLGKHNANRIRKMDAKAYERLKKKMTVVELSAADREAWKKVLVPVMKQLAGTTFSKDLMEKVLKASGKG
jgi:MYXO-CTERM domain-containing protein